MATTTTIKCTANAYGNSNNESYSQTSPAHLYVGSDGNYHFRTRLKFPALSSVSGIGTNDIIISKILLYLYRDDEGPALVYTGSSTSSSWSASRSGVTSDQEVSASTGWKSLNVTTVAPYIVKYTSSWYLHLRGRYTANRIRFDSINGGRTPYIKVTWEYAGGTLSTSSENTELGTSVTFNIKRRDADATYTLTYSIGDTSGTIASKTTSTSIKWTPPISLASEITDNDIGTVTVKLTAYNSSGSVVRSETLPVEVTVPENIVPVIPSDGISIGYVNTFSGKILRGFTSLKITPKVDLNSGYGSTVSKMTASITSGSVTNTVTWTTVDEVDAGIYEGSPVTTSPISAAGVSTIKLTVTDSRGRTATSSTTVTVEDYSPPVISKFEVNRCEPVYDANEAITGYTKSDVGENVMVTFAASVYDILIDGASANKLTWTITSVNVETGTETKHTGSVNASSISKTDDLTIITEKFNAQHAYDVSLSIKDSVGVTVVAYNGVAPGRANFALAKSKYGVAVGGLPKGTEANPLFECYYPTKMYSSLDVSGNAAVTGTLSTTGTFTANGALNAKKNATVSGNLSVSGTSTFTKAVALNGGVSNFGNSVQSGYVDISSVAENASKTVTITFAKAFKSAPIVMVCLDTGSTNYTYGAISVGVVNGSVKTTGFKIIAFNRTSGGTKNPGVSWLAIGTM